MHDTQLRVHRSEHTHLLQPHLYREHFEEIASAFGSAAAWGVVAHRLRLLLEDPHTSPRRRLHLQLLLLNAEVQAGG